VNASEQARPIPSLGTNEETDNTSSQMKSDLRHFYFDRIFLITAKLTAIVDDILCIPCNLVRALLLPTRQAVTSLAHSTFETRKK
jgi:hypothetical protein